MPNAVKLIKPTPQDVECLKKVVEKRGKDWSVLIAQVDPDGIANGFQIAAILESLGASPQIYYAGGFGHPQNRILHNRFELMKHMKPIAEMPDAGVKALADSSRLDDSRLEKAIAKECFGLIFDHHLENPPVGGDCFPYIRSTGAAATLGWLFMNEMKIEIPRHVAELTAVGIFSDTDRLTSPATTPEDRRAFVEAMETAGQELIDECFNYTLPERYLEIERSMLETIGVIEHVRVAYAPELLREDEGDYLSIVADRLRRVDGAHTIVVWGVCGEWVRASVRSRSKELDLTAFIESIFGKKNGGAKHGSGGARYRLPAQLVPTAASAAKFISSLDEITRERIKNALGAPERKRAPKAEKTPT